MRAKGLGIGRIAGIPLRIAPSWLLVFGGMSWIVADAYLPTVIEVSPTLYWVLGAATTLLFFATVLLHEMGHALVSRAQGTEVRQVTLHFFGGLAEVDSPPKRPRDELLTALVGPALTVGIGLLFGLLFTLTRDSYPLLAAPARVMQVINIGLGLFNLLPGLPLDGGRVLRAALWAVTGSPKKATRWAARMGQWLGILIMSAGVLLVVRDQLDVGMLAALIGLSLHQSARAAHSKASLEQMLDGRIVADLMQPHSAMLSLNDTMDRLPHEMLMGDTAGYLVGEGGRVVGLVSLRRVRRVPRDAWAHTRLEAVVLRRQEIESVSPDTPLVLALQRMTGNNMAQLPVESNGELEGILSRQRIITFVEMQTGARAER